LHQRRRRHAPRQRHPCARCRAQRRHRQSRLRNQKRGGQAMMLKILQWLNLAGVCGLAVLCTIQWLNNRELNLQRIDLETIRDRQGKTIDQRAATIRGNLADMNDFRDRLARTHDELSAAQTAVKADDTKRTTLEQQLQTAQKEAGDLKTSLEQWK